ncbi:MAG TPA: tetratricopeptide repeat protein [Blastocatellia bacterium]|nr:tetratricopeptide repeat protein [Blastocatellia bacterium]
MSRLSEEKSRLYEFGTFRLDSARRLLLRDDEQVALTAKAFDILVVLVEHSGHIVAKEDLIKRVWPDVVVRESTLAQNIFTLRKTLGEDSHENRFIETVPKFGYRFVADVREVTDYDAAQALREQTSSELARDEAPSFEESDGSKPAKVIPAKAGSSKALVVALAALIVAGVVLALIFSMREEEPLPSEVTTIAVLPFRPVASVDRDEYLEYGMAETLITKLSQINRLVVRPMGSVRKYAGPGQDPMRAGRELKVETVLEGSLQQADGRIRVTARLVRLKDGHALWADEFDERFTDIFQMQDTISQRITEALRLKLTGEEQRLLARRATENTDAYRPYLRGRYFWNQRTEEGYYRAIEHFKQAIDLDRNYALAYAGLADTYHLLGDYGYLSAHEAFPKAKEAATNALNIDPALAEAQTSLAYASFLYDWNWPGAEREFEKALELSPSYPTAHQWYGEYKVAMGRFEEAKAGIKRAQELDPTSLILSSVEGWIYYIARDYDRAITLCRSAVETEASFYPAHFWLGQAYEKKGLYREAIASYEKAVSLSAGSPEALASLGHAYAASGETAKAQKVLDQLKTLSKRRYISPYFTALIYEGLGDKDRAIESLEKGLDERSRSMPFLKVDPMLDSLRIDLRFTELIERVGLR